MKNKNQSLYYGILFYFLYIQIYNIISGVLIVPIVIMRWNVLFIPICLIALIILFSIWFYRKKQFSKIRVWYILLIFILTTVVNIICAPGFYLKGRDFEYREQMPIILNYTYYCMVIFTIVFLTVAYIKYSKAGRETQSE
jgi:hypothetical protein